MGEAKLQLVTMPGCPYCVRAKVFLNKLGEPFDEMDVNSPQGQAAIQTVGANSVPIFLKGTRHLVGFRPDVLTEFLGRKLIVP